MPKREEYLNDYGWTLDVKLFLFIIAMYINLSQVCKSIPNKQIIWKYFLVIEQKYDLIYCKYSTRKEENL